MNDFGTRRLFSSWLLMAIPCSVMAILCGAIAISAVINKSWLWLVFEVFIAYCFASSAIYYWRKYLSQRERRK